jgi:hypothetical protein
MGVTVTPPVAANLADNPKNRLYRATQSGIYSVNIPVGVYEVTRQATTNIIIGSTTIVPSTGISLLFVNDAQSSITFNSTVSADVVPWATASLSSDSIRPGFLQFLNGTYFLTRNGNTFQYSISTDAVTWTNRTYYAVNGEGASNEIAFGVGRYVQALQGESNGPNRIRTSTDLLSWGGVSGQTDRRWYGAKFGQGRFVLCGSNTASNSAWITTSTDGTTWNSATDINLIGSEFFTALEFGNGIFVVGGTVGSMFTSTNGLSWTARQSLFAGNHIRKILWANNMFMAVGNNGTVTTSTDGITWQLRPFNQVLGLTNLTWNPDESIWAVTDAGTSIRYSADNGNTWVARTAIDRIDNSTFIYVNGRYFYATGNDSNAIAVRRVDGENLVFTTQTVPFTDTYIILEYKGTTRVLP